jgi:arabinogalactan oligomer/maltooligosaccharide transport system permease protein
LLLGRSEDFTLAIGLRSLLTNPQDLKQTSYAAGAVIVAVPIAILFISLRKLMIGGITAGGVKG